MSNAYAYQHCQPKYPSCVTPGAKASDPMLYYPNPFAPHGGTRDYCSNNLLLRDLDMRRRALVTPLDCGLKEMIKLNPEPQL